mmetsp:Transcript_41470/g.96987  ORF Transcript_41470/g.96987 Transcript_41470/m.96987 type:complete len:278 (-) Transcript_41470:1415-2248(-)
MRGDGQAELPFALHLRAKLVAHEQRPLPRVGPRQARVAQVCQMQQRRQYAQILCGLRLCGYGRKLLDRRGVVRHVRRQDRLAHQMPNLLSLLGGEATQNVGLLVGKDGESDRGVVVLQDRLVIVPERKRCGGGDEELVGHARVLDVVADACEEQSEDLELPQPQAARCLWLRSLDLHPVRLLYQVAREQERAVHHRHGVLEVVVGVAEVAARDFVEEARERIERDVEGGQDARSAQYRCSQLHELLCREREQVEVPRVQGVGPQFGGQVEQSRGCRV